MVQQIALASASGHPKRLVSCRVTRWASCGMAPSPRAVGAATSAEHAAAVAGVGTRWSSRRHFALHPFEKGADAHKRLARFGTHRKPVEAKLEAGQVNPCFVIAPW